MGTLINAAVAGRGADGFTYEQLHLDDPRADEVLVRIVACGICHTDIAIAAGCTTPCVLGHEGAGVVERVGAAVEDLAAGDHVVLSFAYCGQCAPCRAERPADCEQFMTLNFAGTRLDGSNALSGSVSGHFFGQSSFASHALTNRRNAVHVDPDLPLASLAPLGCGLQTGAGTVLQSLGIGAGQGLVIVGAGAVGLGALMAAHLVGAAPLLVVEPNSQRRAMAERLGASHVVTPEQACAGALEATFPEGAAFAIDTAGDAATLAAIPDWLAEDGRVGYLTGSAGGTLKAGQRGRSIIQGDAYPQRFIPRLIDALRAGEFPLDALIARYPFADIERAIADARAGAVIKPVLVMDTP